MPTKVDTSHHKIRDWFPKQNPNSFEKPITYSREAANKIAVELTVFSYVEKSSLEYGQLCLYATKDMVLKHQHSRSPLAPSEDSRAKVWPPSRYYIPNVYQHQPPNL